MAEEIKKNDLRLKDENHPSAGGLYIHVPFCHRKCLYCDFYTAGSRIADWDRYIGALGTELKTRIGELPFPLHTVYIGGGTPSLIPTYTFDRLTELFGPYMSDVTEFTIEANPEDIDMQTLDTWKRGGVNRLSIGIQTFHDGLLKKIGRIHDAEKAMESYRLAREYFDNISVDLMFGLPGQTLGMWKEDICEALSMRPEHISAYSLMYEEGTAMTLLRDQGRLEEAEDILSEEMYSMLVKELKEAGYEHYELSNFALPGFRSRHNSSYWRQKPYLGLGPGAHSYDGEKARRANRPDLKGYLRHWSPRNDDSDMIRKSSESTFDIEDLTTEELKEEYIMTRLRTCEGIPREDITKRFGEGIWETLVGKAIGWVENGGLVLTESHLHLSENAVLRSDAIIVDLI